MKYPFRLYTFAVALILGFQASAGAQSLVTDLLAGTLVKPKVGQWAWYDLVAKSLSGKPDARFAIRQAVVGQEKVGRKDGYWVEFEIIPELGYTTLYKMLLTGPASDPRNIHKVVLKQGPDPAIELPVAGKAPDEKKLRQKRQSLGMEAVELRSGEILRAEHLSMENEPAKLDVWVNEDVPPIGIVRMSSANGDMLLRTYGIGGEFGDSKLKEEPLPLPADLQPEKEPEQ